MADFAGLRTRGFDFGTISGTCVVGSAGGLATIDVGTAQLVCNVARGLSVGVGDVVLVAKQGSARYVISVLYVAPPVTVPVDTPDTPPAATTITGSSTFTVVSTGSYRAGKWRTDTDDVVQGITSGQANSTGCVFYGKAPKSLSGATVTRATMTVRRMRGGVFAAKSPTLWLVTQSTKPNGAPTLTSSTTGPALAVNATTKTFVLPTAWAQAMVDGTAGGLAVFDSSGDPYLRFPGRGTYGANFAIKMNWRR